MKTITITPKNVSKIFANVSKKLKKLSKRRREEFIIFDDTVIYHKNFLDKVDSINALKRNIKNGFIGYLDKDNKKQ